MRGTGAHRNHASVQLFQTHFQGVQGFPTLKVFPRGGQTEPEPYDSNERTSGKFIRWASRSVPNNVKALPHIHDIPAWLDKVRLSNILPLGLMTRASLTDE